ncbi:hypothetical protein [Nocardioides sp.]|uniref:hypothetical protein n=1 Tax=Nocardioides sp. TaxID=35761 RepID=UPI003519CBB3
MSETPENAGTTDLTGGLTGGPETADATVVLGKHQAPVVAGGTGARPRLACPECGTEAEVSLTRRDAVDFCRQCDFPLFWTPTQIRLDDTRRTAEESLRRLPGTAGRVTVGSVPCPHCQEANGLAAVTCIRCGLPMVVTPVAPPPVPVAAPAPVVVPQPRTPWWVWLVGLLTLALFVTVLVVLITDP